MNTRILVSLPLALTLGAATAHAAGGGTFEAGKLYTTTNDSVANMVAVYTRGVDGAVTFDTFVPTGGKGTGEGLGSQGAVLLTSDERFLLVVNAGSDDISVFHVLDDDLMLASVVPSFGDLPVSLTQHDSLVYAVNNASDSIAGFRMPEDGKLTHIPGSDMPLSGSGVDPAQIGFHPQGDFLYVTEKETNQITIFHLGTDGLSMESSALASKGETPFGFAFGLRNQIFVSEASDGLLGQGTVSSYLAGPRGALRTLTPASPNHGTSTCWTVVTPDGRRLFASNTGSRSISSYAIGFDGDLTLLDGAAAMTAAGPADMTLTRDGRFLYVLDAAGGTVGDYGIDSSASLVPVAGTNDGLPASAAGLAVR